MESFDPNGSFFDVNMEASNNNHRTPLADIQPPRNRTATQPVRRRLYRGTVKTLRENFQDTGNRVRTVFPESYAPESLLCTKKDSANSPAFRKARMHFNVSNF